MGFRFSKSNHSWTPGSFPTGPTLFPGHPCSSPCWPPQPQVIAVASPPTVIQVPVPFPVQVPVPVLVPTPVQLSMPSPVISAPAIRSAPPPAYVRPSPYMQMPSPPPIVIQAQVSPAPAPPDPHPPTPHPHPQPFVQVNADHWGGAGHPSSHLCPPQHQGPHSSHFTVNVLTPLNTPQNQQAQLPEPHPGYHPGHHRLAPARW